ncbi:hypothetical protein [Photobacterium atrarenae]|uniref:Uncharacterized protein n=1 Tax=Photobacterium atrarenae TaxID=865757 RepID=A0ABY5GKU3_9GAMM|nr:hypothetical protein [Photobacterium atrarenae]UTV29538.1 hypothetical protein NNL38_21205 [Photobacterium atrarenae]
MSRDKVIGKRSIPFLIIAICVALTFVPVFYPIEVDQRGLELPPCADEPVVITPIHFFVSEGVLKDQTMDEVQFRLHDAIQTSNEILTNSCVPMRRKLGEIQVVDFTQEVMWMIEHVYQGLARQVGKPALERLHAQPNHFYGVMLGKSDRYFDDFSGEAAVELNDRMFVIAHDADDDTVEHELGHLAWAQHQELIWFSYLSLRLNRTTSEANQNKLKPYARGYSCSGEGTVMSYHDLRLPIYSSPDIDYRGNVCGDANKADNARIMRDYAQALRQQILAGQDVQVNK